MTRRDALIALRDAVVKEQQDAMAAAAKNALPGRTYVLSVRAFDHHIADAIDLVDEVLCGWHWSISVSRSGPGATVWHEPDKCTAVHHGKGRGREFNPHRQHHTPQGFAAPHLGRNRQNTAGTRTRIRAQSVRGVVESFPPSPYRRDR